MEKIRLFFYLIRLVLANLPFLFQYFWTTSPLKITFLLATLLLLLHLALFSLAGQTTQQWQQILSRYFIDIDRYQKQERQEQIIIWEKKLQAQPTHRDILLTIAELYCLNENNVACLDYWQRASAVDPNNDQVIQFQKQYLEK